MMNFKPDIKCCADKSCPFDLCNNTAQIVEFLFLFPTLSVFLSQQHLVEQATMFCDGFFYYNFSLY